MVHIKRPESRVPLIGPDTIHLTQFCSDWLKIRFDVPQDYNACNSYGVLKYSPWLKFFLKF